MTLTAIFPASLIQPVSPGSLLTVSLPAPPRIVTGTNSTTSMPIPTVLLLPSPMSLAPSRSSRVICVADRLSFRTSLAR